MELEITLQKKRTDIFKASLLTRELRLKMHVFATSKTSIIVVTQTNYMCPWKLGLFPFRQKVDCLYDITKDNLFYLTAHLGSQSRC